MNIHEHQAKEILKKYGAIVPAGVFSTNVDDLIEKAKNLKTEKYVLKAQIHAGGRGKGGGVKIAKSLDEVKEIANKMIGMMLITPQTPPDGKKVRKILSQRMFIIRENQKLRNSICRFCWIEKIVKIL